MPATLAASSIKLIKFTQPFFKLLLNFWDVKIFLVHRRANGIGKRELCQRLKKRETLETSLLCGIYEASRGIKQAGCHNQGVFFHLLHTWKFVIRVGNCSEIVKQAACLIDTVFPQIISALE